MGEVVFVCFWLMCFLYGNDWCWWLTLTLDADVDGWRRMFDVDAWFVECVLWMRVDDWLLAIRYWCCWIDYVIGWAFLWLMLDVDAWWWGWWSCWRLLVLPSWLRLVDNDDGLWRAMWMLPVDSGVCWLLLQGWLLGDDGAGWCTWWRWWLMIGSWLWYCCWCWIVSDYCCDCYSRCPMHGLLVRDGDYYDRCCCIMLVLDCIDYERDLCMLVLMLVFDIARLMYDDHLLAIYESMLMLSDWWCLVMMIDDFDWCWTVVRCILIIVWCATLDVWLLLTDVLWWKFVVYIWWCILDDHACLLLLEVDAWCRCWWLLVVIVVYELCLWCGSCSCWR